jgi:hypothetical protein
MHECVSTALNIMAALSSLLSMHCTATSRNHRTFFLVVNREAGSDLSSKINSRILSMAFPHAFGRGILFDETNASDP